MTIADTDRPIAVVVFSDPEHGGATLFGATEAITANGLELLGVNAIPGTPGVASLRRVIDRDHRVVGF